MPSSDDIKTTLKPSSANNRLLKSLHRQSVFSKNSGDITPHSATHGLITPRRATAGQKLPTSHLTLGRRLHTAVVCSFSIRLVFCHWSRSKLPVWSEWKNKMLVVAMDTCAIYLCGACSTEELQRAKGSLFLRNMCLCYISAWMTRFW